MQYGLVPFVQDAAKAALAPAGDQEVRKVHAIYRERRDVFCRVFFEASAGTNTKARVLVPPPGSMYCLVDVRQTRWSSGLDFAEQLFDRHRIAVVAGEGFGSHTHGFLRVALTVDAAAVERAARAICDVGAAR